MSKQQMYLNIFMLIATCFAVPVTIFLQKQKQENKKPVVHKKQIHNKYVRYNKNVFTRNRFRRIVTQFSTLSCYDMDTIKMESVKLFEKSVGTSIGMIVLGIVLFRDILMTLLMCLISYVHYNITVEKRIDDVYKEVILDVSFCIQSIRENYMESSNVVEAVLKSDKGRFLEQPMQRIYEMLTAVDSENRLYSFCQTTPIRIIRTLAMICYITNERGDEREADNSSAFADQMTSLRQEADTEMRRLVKLKAKLKSLPNIALAGIIIAAILETFLVSQIPATATVFKGIYGYMYKTILILVVAYAYYYISICGRPTVVNIADKVPWIDAISKNRFIRGGLKNLLPKKYKTRMKLKKKIQDAVSSKTLEYIYTCKMVCSIGIGIVALLFIIAASAITKSYLWNTTRSLSFTSQKLELTEKAAARLKRVDKYYMSQIPKMDDEEAISYLKAHVPELTSMEAQNEFTRLSSKYDKYYASGYKWYYALIAIVSAIIGWFIPEISLSMRKKLVTFEETEDVMQIQTMMLALSNTTMNIMDVLYWLEKQSTIHKAPIGYALQEYASDPIKALSRLRYAVGSADLKRLVNKLETAVYNLSLKEAFSDFKLDKEQLLRLREIAQDQVIESKTRTASFLADAPISITLMLGFVAPVLILGMTELMRAVSVLS